MTAALVQLPEPCWVTARTDGVDCGDPETHHHTQAEAEREATRLDQAAPLTAVRLDEPCWTATAECGYRYDEDGEGIEHGPTRADLLTALLAAGWRATTGGGMTCGHNECDTCPSLPVAPLPVEIGDPHTVLTA